MAQAIAWQSSTPLDSTCKEGCMVSPLFSSRLSLNPGWGGIFLAVSVVKFLQCGLTRAEFIEVYVGECRI